MADINLNTAAIHRLLHDPDGPVGRDLTRRAESVQRVAKTLVPVDTGRLKASITHGTVHHNRGELRVLVGSRVHYSFFVEAGTSRAHAQPYLRPALSAART